ncbi:LacI family DNA-binding transcriptional regulator [Paenibacillus arenilitoris]|uniref:LacI family DNA-binding transcriptional regulator n=1 Tax=Paenibacillus arenilitoris TaxID=2772299 RepID=A0A927CJU1_9BACL|nr:LacI family DNA-binding transcriptional regulator [Paenibacillus arenilitoris]MBD2868785.1 LacI family DNA-binding transcriptional regulator [Paenibacillus arenilitoris]
MGPTIHDVAKLAKTSKSTVSRYLNGQQVKKATQEALEKAIKELNFHRNANARRLVMDKTYTIGIVIDDISNIFYSGIIKGIEEIAGKNGYNCIFLSWTSNYDNEISFLNLLYEGQVDGIIMVSFRKRSEKDLLKIREADYPIALIGDHGELDGIFSVDVDNAAGIADVVHYLHDIGHRKIAYISGPETVSASKYRFKGYKQTLEALGLEYNPEWVVESDWTNQGGYASIGSILDKSEVTAVVASSDETAIGALRRIQESGRYVPKDMSIVGFDDVTVSSWVYPSLTTVRQPFREIGKMAAEGLFRKIAGEEEEARSHLLKPQLIIRDSCGKLL